MYMYGVYFFRYSREESFMTFMIDIRNQHNLAESLEQFVKGDLLEGNNAYHCEKCNKKVCGNNRGPDTNLKCFLFTKFCAF